MLIGHRCVSSFQQRDTIPLQTEISSLSHTHTHTHTHTLACPCMQPSQESTLIVGLHWWAELCFTQQVKKMEQGRNRDVKSEELWHMWIYECFKWPQCPLRWTQLRPSREVVWLLHVYYIFFLFFVFIIIFNVYFTSFYVKHFEFN